MDIQEEREAFEAWYCRNHTGLKQSDLAKFRTLSGYSFSDSLKINISWEAWQAAKAQAVPEGFVLVPKEPTEKMIDAGQTGSLYNITSESHHLHSGFVRKLEATLRQRVNNGTGVILEINCNADLYYHMLSSHIAEHDKFGVVESLGEVS